MGRVARLRHQQSKGQSAESIELNTSGLDVGPGAERREQCMRRGSRSHGASSGGQVGSMDTVLSLR